MFSDIKIGPLTLHMYGLMIALGFLAALQLSLKRCRKKGLSEDMVWGMFYCALIGGLLGARILFLIVEIPHIMEDPSIIWDLRNGYVVYGGILGGIFLCWAYCRRKKSEFLPYLDLMLPAVSLGQAFGRIGCFCAGCCYGRETTSPLGIVFTNSHYAPNGVRLIPTQLISSAADLALCLILIGYASRKPAKGRVASAWLLLYGAGRFALEFLRNDFRGSVGPFSTSQMVSFGIVAVGAILWYITGETGDAPLSQTEEKVSEEENAEE